MTITPREPRSRLHRFFVSGPLLLLAFAFTVMADPVSSVAYAVEAALRALHGDLQLLLPTMGLVVFIIGLVIVNYHQLVARFPDGGGAAAAIGLAFGEAWSFIPIGALIVDFVLTIAISAAAAGQAVVAYVPSWQHALIPIAVVFLLLVGGFSWFGHASRVVFATMTLIFIALSYLVIAGGLRASAVSHPAPYVLNPGHLAGVAILLAFPVAMALATGVEAPSSAIAQLAQLDDAGRRRFGRVTLWLTLLIVGTTTMGLTWVAVRLRIGVPKIDGAQISNIAHASSGPVVYGLFQLFTSLLLLAAASSSFQAGPGLLKALSRRPNSPYGILPECLGRSNRHHTPYWSVALFTALAGFIVVVARANDQVIVLYYAVSVFMSFLAGLLSMAVFARRERRWGQMFTNLFGVVVVSFTLIVDVLRGRPAISVLASLMTAGLLLVMWRRAGKPRGIAHAVVEAEREAD